MKRSAWKRMNANPWWFKLILLLFFGTLTLLTLYPMWDVLMGSFMPLSTYMNMPIRLFPKNFTLAAYTGLFQMGDVGRALKNTLFVTVIGTSLHMLIMNMAAYVLSRQYFYGRSVVLKMVLFAMLFYGGLIPSYINAKNLGLIDTLWVLILVPLINPYYLIVTRTYYQGMPASLEESARLDGAGDFTVFLRIYVPSALPIIATMCLFIVVDRWNNYSNNIYYTSGNNTDTLQMMLYRMLNNQDKAVAEFSENLVNDKSRRMAGIVIAAAPLMFIYPFLQKYFAKGLMIGSIKG